MPASPAHGHDHGPLAQLGLTHGHHSQSSTQSGDFQTWSVAIEQNTLRKCLVMGLYVKFLLTIFPFSVHFSVFSP